MTFSEWLQAQLDERGWKPADLARRADIPYPTVWAYVKGTRGQAGTASPETLAAIARALTVPEGVVLEAAGRVDPGRSEHDRTAQRWAALGASLTPEQERTAWAMLQAFRRTQP